MSLDVSLDMSIFHGSPNIYGMMDSILTGESVSFRIVCCHSGFLFGFREMGSMAQADPYRQLRSVIFIPSIQRLKYDRLRFVNTTLF